MERKNKKNISEKTREMNIRMQRSIQETEAENSQKAIGVVGLGGGGTNSVMYVYNELHKFSFLKIDYFAINTDAQALGVINSKSKAGVTKILVGGKTLNGLGTGAKPKVGYEATKESIEDGELEEVFVGRDVLLISAGLGGGTGSGGTAAIVEEAKKRGIITIVFGTFPWDFEGPKRLQNAVRALNSFYKISDSALIVNNDFLMDEQNDANKADMFYKTNKYLRYMILTIANMVMEHSYINLDFNDFKNAIKKSKFGFFHMQETTILGDNRLNLWEEFLKELPDDLDISESKNLMINFSGRKSTFSLEYVKNFLANINELAPNIDVLFGITYNEYIAKNNLKFSCIFTDVKYKFLKDEYFK